MVSFSYYPAPGFQKMIFSYLILEIRELILGIPWEM